MASRPLGESGRKTRKPKPARAKPQSTKTIYYRPPRQPAPDPILAQLKAIFGPQQSYLQNAVSQQQAQSTAEATRKQQLYQQYAQWYGSHVPQQVQGIYSQAANEQSHFAKGFSDGMKIAQDQTAGEANKLMQTAGSPMEARIHPNANASDVLYGTGGFFPASTLSTQGAAFGAAAALMPGAIVAEGGRQAQKIREASDASIAKLQGELVKLRAKAAETGLKLSESRRAERIKLKLEKLKMRIAAQKDAEMMSYRWASLDFQQKKAILSDRNEAKRIYQAQQRIGLASRSQSFGEWYKQQTLAQGDERLRQGQQRLTKTSSKPKYTPIQLSRFKADAADSAKDAWTGIKNDSGVWELEPQTYGAAYADMVQHGIPEWVAQNALNRYWKRRGFTVTSENRMDGKFNVWEKSQSGRPLKDFYNPKGAAARGGRENTAFPLSTRMTSSSEFNVSDPEGAPSASGGRYHAAKDWFAPADSPVFSVEAGRVVEVSPSRGTSGQIYGGVVKVQTADGRVWVFRHVVPGSVRVGQRVRAGQRIARVSPWTGGSTHSHIELWKTLGGGYRYENMIDPMSFFSGLV